METKEKPEGITVAVPIEVSIDQIWNAFVGAFEGGSNYWLREANMLAGNEPEEKGVVWWGSKNIYNIGLEIEVKYDDPDKEEGNGSAKKKINWLDIQKGLQIMGQKYPRHFSDLVSENDDADTHDVFMQCIILGDVVYG